MLQSGKDPQFLRQWLSKDQLALHGRLVFFSDASSRTILDSLEDLAEAQAKISRMEATATAREKQIRELTERCRQIDITKLSEWPRMVRAIRVYYATDMESTRKVGNAAFAVECADSFAAAAMEAIGPDARVKDVEQS